MRKAIFLIIIFINIIFLLSCNSNSNSSSSKIFTNENVSTDYLYESYQPLLVDIDVKTFKEWQEIIDCDSITNHCQSMAIYNDYVFNFSAYNDVYIFSLYDQSYYSHAKFPYSAHCNSAQFINFFYDKNDSYPLLLVSNCEINETINWNTVSVIRVIENNGEFNFNLIKTIKFYDNSFRWGSSIVYNESSNLFFSVSNSNGPYDKFVDNSNIILCFDGIDNWINGINEERYNGDIIFVFPSHIVFQAIELYDKYLFVGAQINTNHDDYWYSNSGICGTSIIVLNLDDYKIKILDIKYNEIEGVCYYKKEFYVQCHLSTSKNVYDECLWISKFKYILE